MSMNDELGKLYSTLTTYLLGSQRASELLITGLLADGHVLIQGPPGMGKTSLAKTIASSIQTSFKRIQFTPDLLPSEILGYSIYDQASASFVLHRGPVFCNVLLADEINRASPRTQSALLEAMQECQVSIDGVTYKLGKPFFVIATENNISSLGTFPLPDSQLDRFLLSFEMPSPDHGTHVAILESHAKGLPYKDVPPVMNGEQLVAMQTDVRAVHVSRAVMEYVSRLCQAVGSHKALTAGPSTRASIAVMNAARAQAYIHDRESVYPDDVKSIFTQVLRHRLTTKQGSARNIGLVENILDEIKNTTPVPMARQDA